MRWAKKTLIAADTYTSTTTSATFHFEPRTIEHGAYIIIRPTSADDDWNINVDMAPLATGAFAEVANLDDCAANLNEKAIFIPNSTIITKMPTLIVELEKTGAAASVGIEVYMKSILD